MPYPNVTTGSGVKNICDGMSFSQTDLQVADATYSDSAARLAVDWTTFNANKPFSKKWNLAKFQRKKVL